MQVCVSDAERVGLANAEPLVRPSSASATDIVPVILCGGSGTRLWPLSRKALPKQFVPLVQGKSRMRLTLERAALLRTAPLIVAAEDHRFLVQECAADAGVQSTILLEPVADLSTPDANGNRVHGQGHMVKSTNTFIHTPHRPVVALGTHNLLIIDTVDVLLVADASHAEQAKTVVAQLEAAGVSQAQHHRHVARPWGTYDSGARFQVKRIVVKPGATLSLQMHLHRAEHRVVVSGTA